MDSQDVVPVWQFHASGTEGFRYMYAVDPTEKQGWIRDDIVWYAYLDNAGGRVPIYRYHQVKPGGGWYFTYSSNPNLGGGWLQDGIVWYAFSVEVPNTVPIYQYQPASTDGLRFVYTQNANFGDDWVLDGVAFHTVTSFQ